MKNTILLLLLFSAAVSCKAQSIKDINTYDLNQGDYRKDIYNELDPYTGIWQGVWSNKKITLYLTKITYHYVSDELIGYYYKDFVIGRYKVEDLNTGAIIEDTTSYNIADVTLYSVSLNRNNNFIRCFYYNPIDPNECKTLGQVILKRNLSNPNELMYSYNPDTEMKYGCPYQSINDIPIDIPKVNITLTKL